MRLNQGSGVLRRGFGFGFGLYRVRIIIKVREPESRLEPHFSVAGCERTADQERRADRSGLGGGAVGSAARGEAQVSHQVSRARLAPGPARLMGLAAAWLIWVCGTRLMHAAPQGGQGSIYRC